jgi:hypothetical protein
MTSKLKVNLINDAGDNNLITSDGSGSVTLGTAFPAVGKIGQVVQTTKSDLFSTSSTSLVDITGLSASITPSSTSSKIFVMLNGHANSSQASVQLYTIKLLRDSTGIGGVDSGNRIFRSYGVSNAPQTFSTFLLDEPSTTSSTTYKAQVNVSGDTVYIGGFGNAVQAPTTITLMEVLP